MPACGLSIGARRTYLWCSAQSKEFRLCPYQTNHGFLREVLAVLGNALATATAIRQGTEPKARNLRGLGIDPAEFRKINHYH